MDRVSHIGACELLLPPEEVSLLSAVICSPSQRGAAATSLGSSPSLRLDPGVAGALLERQLDGLEPSRWKEGVRDIYVKLLKDALHVYKIDAGHTDPSPSSECMPIRRARVLTKCMEFAYRDQNGAEDVCAALGLGNVEDIADEVESLASKEVGFSPYFDFEYHAYSSLAGFRTRRPTGPLYSSISRVCSYMGRPSCPPTSRPRTAQHNGTTHRACMSDHQGIAQSWNWHKIGYYLECLQICFGEEE